MPWWKDCHVIHTHVEYLRYLKKGCLIIYDWLFIWVMLTCLRGAMLTSPYAPPSLFRNLILLKRQYYPNRRIQFSMQFSILNDIISGFKSVSLSSSRIQRGNPIQLSVECPLAKYCKLKTLWRICSLIGILGSVNYSVVMVEWKQCWIKKLTVAILGW